MLTLVLLWAVRLGLAVLVAAGVAAAVTIAVVATVDVALLAVVATGVAGYYQIPTYGKGGNWYAYWNMYEQPKIKPKLAVGFDFWWSNPQKAAQVSQYLRRQK